jgi:hypothetical protein
LHLPGMGHGLEIRDDHAGTEPATVRFGPIRAIIDNLRMGTVAHPQPLEPGRRIENLSMIRGVGPWNQVRKE